MTAPTPLAGAAVPTTAPVRASLPPHTASTLGAYVYRMFSADDRCLYVGMTCDPRDRMNLHERRSPFLAHVARIEWGPEVDWRDAHVDEVAVIGELRPLFNQHHNPDYQELASKAERGALYAQRLAALTT